MKKQYYIYKYPHPAVAVDCVVFGVVSSCLEILLIQRRNEPYKDSWALPGGFLGIDESLEEAVIRELSEEINYRPEYLYQIGAFGDPDRDPRERVISIAYYTFLQIEKACLVANSDAAKLEWFYIRNLPNLAFDHLKIVNAALEILQKKVKCEPFGYGLLPSKFRLSLLQSIYEDIIGEPLDKRNFRKKLLKYGLVKPLNEFEKIHPHRPARLYEFNYENYIKYKEKGIDLTR
jgi:8-oxo-dGTP diphosphatase